MIKLISHIIAVDKSFVKDFLNGEKYLKEVF